MIKLSNVTKAFNGKKVVDDVTLDIPQNKITAFIGPNGAGKSTLFSLMSRLTSLDEGTVHIDQVAIDQWKSHELAQTLAILKQSNGINLSLTVRDLVGFGRFPYSKSRLKAEDIAKIDEAISFMELEDMQHQYIDELSGGQRQRVYIAMILAQDTKYILLDEPLNNLDIKHSIQMMKTLQKMTQELQKTVMIVMHDINFSASYADHIIAMKRGKKVYAGPVKEIIQTDILKDIYDVNLNVAEVNQCKVCLYV